MRRAAQRTLWLTGSLGLSVLFLSSSAPAGAQEEFADRARIGTYRGQDVYLRISAPVSLNHPAVGGFRSDGSLFISPTQVRTDRTLVQFSVENRFSHGVEGFSFMLGDRQLQPHFFAPTLTEVIPPELLEGPGPLRLVVRDPDGRVLFDRNVLRPGEVAPGEVKPPSGAGSVPPEEAKSPPGPRGVSPGEAKATGGAGGPLVPCVGAEPCTLEQLKELGRNIFNWLLAIGGAAALLALIVAGIRYLTAVLQGADSSAIAAAKQSIVYAIIGLVVLLMAYVIVNTILNIFEFRTEVRLRTIPSLPGLPKLKD
ncbi:MAG: hypothetical protein G01um101438_824 [Parcubacteria group bacterium Gr01-1014_38]|nr:MAG: hypothetical protein G01um101438_824 [Parcubacteria group bacterium Gr01-1014_38]